MDGRGSLPARAPIADGGVSIIALFSFLGITLGVATLIVVMSVMNGFHHELMDKILGVNGHAFVQARRRPSPTGTDVAAKTAKVPASKPPFPWSRARRAYRRNSGSRACWRAAFARRISRTCPASPAMCARARCTGLRPGWRRRHRSAPRRHARRARRRQGQPPDRQRRADALWRRAAHQEPIQSSRSSRSACRSSTIVFVYMPLAEAQAFLQQGE